MEVSVVSQNDNQLIGRKEFVLDVSFEGATPKRSEIKDVVCRKVGANPDLSVVRRIDVSYGTHIARVLLHTYSDEGRMKEIEPEYILKRNEAPKEGESDGGQES